MRRIVVSEFLSLDGVMEGPGDQDKFEHAGWTMPFWNTEIGKFKQEELFDCDSLLLGRITYQGFAETWPLRKDDQGFADRMNNIPKYVASTTLKKLDWNNSHLIGGHLAGEVMMLKEKPGKDILVAGSSVLIQTLMPHDLIDEYRLLVYPLILGSGKQLFKDGSFKKLKEVEAKLLGKNVILLKYR
jgi:dihydrofolate reductase